MEDDDGDQCTIDSTAAFDTARRCVCLLVRLRLLADSPICLAGMGGIG